MHASLVLCWIKLMEILDMVNMEFDLKLLSDSPHCRLHIFPIGSLNL